ncbi:hypothetical protein M877_06805 [Streptomyces niveus NCIMB 11891]|nr:hypothetical protein M877_06805 [Streptomyces niveus NCIMB 11891]
MSLAVLEQEASYNPPSEADIFPMTHHVECVTILEPVGKGA